MGSARITGVPCPLGSTSVFSEVKSPLLGVPPSIFPPLSICFVSGILRRRELTQYLSLSYFG